MLLRSTRQRESGTVHNGLPGAPPWSWSWLAKVATVGRGSVPLLRFFACNIFAREKKRLEGQGSREFRNETQTVQEADVRFARTCSNLRTRAQTLYCTYSASASCNHMHVAVGISGAKQFFSGEVCVSVTFTIKIFDFLRYCILL